MPDPEDPAEAAARLETALDRIAARADRARTSTSTPTPPLEQTTIQAADTRAVAARLDGLITRLRAALAQGTGPAHEPVTTNVTRHAADQE